MIEKINCKFLVGVSISVATKAEGKSSTNPFFLWQKLFK
jgi:hypothetical protein